jgi:hypothetical protein
MLPTKRTAAARWPSARPPSKSAKSRRLRPKATIVPCGGGIQPNDKRIVAFCMASVAGALIDIGPPQVYFLSLLAVSIGVELRQLAFLAAESAWFFVRNERSAYPAIHTISEGA